METKFLLTGTIAKITDNIYYYYLLDNDILPETRQKNKDLKAILSFVGQSPFFLVIDLRDLDLSNPKKIRSYIVNSFDGYLIASAIITNSKISKIVGDIFFSFQQHSPQRKFFSSKETAIQWIRTYREAYLLNSRDNEQST